MKAALIIIISVFMLSCSEDSGTSNLPGPHISDITPDTAYTGGIIDIHGSGFGYKVPDAYVKFDSAIKVYSAACIKWNNIHIQLEVPEGIKYGYVSVYSEGAGSNTFTIEVNRTPLPEMVNIPAGSFKMGSDAGFPDEKPVREVSITNSFRISKSEVSEELWESVMGSRKGYDDKKMPAGNISWIEAVEFCNKLSKINSLDTVYIINGKTVTFNREAGGYRLPTEAEWEYACKAGSGEDYTDVNKLGLMGWYNGNSGLMPHPSGRKEANSFGVFDMPGNYAEWCWDWYEPGYYQSGAVSDPAGPTEGERRVLRGGSYMDGSAYIRPSARSVENFSQAACTVRLVRSIE